MKCAGVVRGVAVALWLAAGMLAKGDVTNANWASVNGFLGTSSYVCSMACDSAGDLYAGGSFLYAGNAVCNGLAKWDGGKWAAVAPVTALFASVSTFVFDAAGNLYVSGCISSEHEEVAKWDGKSWAVLGQIDGVSSLACDSLGNLYVGGSFTSVEGMVCYGVAKWDGSKWSTVGGGVGGEPYGWVCSLLCDSSDNLYIGGKFSSVGNNVAKWNGKVWTALASGVDDQVDVLALDGAGTLFAGGRFASAGAVACNRLAKWDGTSWSALGAGVDDEVKALVCDNAGNLYAGGRFTRAGGRDCNYAARWDGESWHALGAGANSTVFALACDNAGKLYVGGDFSRVGDGLECDNAAKWDGSAWVLLGDGVNGAVYALAPDGDGNLYAGGDFLYAGGVVSNSIAKWDGAGWSRLGLGMNEEVRALAHTGSGGRLYAGGVFTKAGDVNCNYIAQWRNSEWRPLGNGVNDIVDKLALNSAGNLYVAGAFNRCGDNLACTGLAKWDGSDWTPFTETRDGWVAALACDNSGNLFVGGTFTKVGELTCNRVAKWNGGSWKSLGAGMNGRVEALVCDDAGNLYAGGWFTQAGGVDCKYVAKWDGSAWSPLGEGTNHYVYALELDASGALLVGGQFDKAGGAKHHYVAKWDGAAWISLGDLGGGEEVSCLRRDGSNLFASGYFTVAGDVPSPFVARCDLALESYNVTFATVGETPLHHGQLVGKLAQAVVAGGDCSPVEAVPDVGYAFSGWTGDHVGDENPLTLTGITKNMVVTASFVPAACTVKFLSGGDGWLGGELEQTVPYGGGASAVEAHADFGHHFVGWTGDYVGNDNPLELSTVTKDMIITANFAPDTYVVVFVDGVHGTLEGELTQTVEHGDNCTPILAVPDASYEFLGWTGSHVGVENPLIITNVTSHMTILANFAKAADIHSVTFLAGAGGTLSCADGVDTIIVQKVADGGSCAPVTAVPDTGRHFDAWTGGASGAANPLTVENVTTDLTITANFAADPVQHTVTFLAGAGGTLGDASDTIVVQTVVDGGSCAPVTAVPDSGHYFDQWTGGVASVENPLTVTGVTADLVVVATFAAQPVFHVAPGSVFEVTSKAVLTKAPKVETEDGVRAKVLTPAKDFKAGVKTFACQWTSSKSAPGVYSLSLDGVELTSLFHVEQPVLAGLSSHTGGAGDKITATGTFFGSSCPKAFLRYNDAKGKEKWAACKVTKPYAYADAKGKTGKSVMDVGTGASRLEFTVPKKITVDTAATLVLEFKFAAPIEREFNAAD